MKATLIKEAGVVRMDKPFDYLCSKLRNGCYTVTVSRKASPRSVSQNALMWMWLKCLEDQTGQPKEDFHDYYAARFLARPITIGREVRYVAGRTSQLTVEQFSEFLDKIQADAATEFGVALPRPEDRYWNDFAEEFTDRI